MRTSAIIVAAGSGRRLGAGQPKAFVSLGGRTLLARSLATVAALRELFEVVITVPPGMETEARAEARRAGMTIPVKITAGGIERQDSVRIALSLTSAESDLVVIHDAARPFASPALFERCIEAAARCGGAIAAIPVADTLKRVEKNMIEATLPRAGLYQAQTPQAFRRRLLIDAHERARAAGITATDDADLVERLGQRVEIVEAAALNLKITTRSDLQIAEAIAATLEKQETP
jgi:2-C-methyl-D-erythritol 4-phosphate cytidylyltransferase